MHIDIIRKAVSDERSDLVADFLVGKLLSEIDIVQLTEWATGPHRFYYEWSGRYLTNTDIDVPVRRPERDEWARYPDLAPLKAIAEADWQLVLDVLEDNYLDEIIWPEVRKAVTREKQERATTEKVRQRLEEMAARFYTGPFITKVAVGRDFIFTVETIIGKPLFVVDTPRYGHALYIFLNYTDARAWVARQITVAEARSRAAIVIMHTETWNERLAERMAELMESLKK
jgi:hypothetical protein